MDFYINDEKIDITLEEEKTVGDVLKSFEITCEENETAVIGLRLKVLTDTQKKNWTTA